MATVTRADGTTSNVSTRADWQSSDTAVVRVSAVGLVTALAYGAADVTATYQSATNTMSVRVIPPPQLGVNSIGEGALSSPIVCEIAVFSQAGRTANGDDFGEWRLGWDVL
jgi:ABC-type molybdate transport system substrate-binding protein